MKTVSDLIKILEKFRPDQVVVIDASEGDFQLVESVREIALVEKGYDARYMDEFLANEDQLKTKFNAVVIK